MENITSKAVQIYGLGDDKPMGLLMSPIDYSKLEKIRHESGCADSLLFAGSIRQYSGMDVVTHNGIPENSIFKIPAELVLKYQRNPAALASFVSTLGKLKIVNPK